MPSIRLKYLRHFIASRAHTQRMYLWRIKHPINKSSIWQYRFSCYKLKQTKEEENLTYFRRFRIRSAVHELGEHEQHKGLVSRRSYAISFAIGGALGAFENSLTSIFCLERAVPTTQ